MNRGAVLPHSLLLSFRPIHSAIRGDAECDRREGSDAEKEEESCPVEGERRRRSFAAAVSNDGEEEGGEESEGEEAEEGEEEEERLLMSSVDLSSVSSTGLWRRKALWIRGRDLLPAWFWPVFAVGLFLLIDHFVRPPHGLLPLRALTGARTWSNEPCGWDYEGSWKIGLARGASPFTLVPEVRPVVTCADITSLNVSFVADPFMVLTVDQRPLLTPLSWYASHSAAHESLAGTTLYVFFEMKSLSNGLGQIGVSKSSNQGQSFHFAGTALELPQVHLSYPIIFFEPLTDCWLMIPEQSRTLSVHVYTTSSSAFPFGWTYHSQPLQGKHFVDISPVYYHSLWYIFVTFDDSLHLYTTSSLLASNWDEHPLSPVVVKDRHFARSGGRPFLFDGHVYRVSQDDALFYGERLHFFRLDALSPALYQESHVHEMTRNDVKANNALWASERMHHLDAHHVAASEWWAVLDGDDKPDDYQYFEREGWFRALKQAVLIPCLLIAFCLLAVTIWSVHDGLKKKKRRHRGKPSILWKLRISRSFSVCTAWVQKCVFNRWTLVVVVLFLAWNVFLLVVGDYFGMYGSFDSGLAFQLPTIAQLRSGESTGLSSLHPQARALITRSDDSVGTPKWFEFIQLNFTVEQLPLREVLDSISQSLNAMKFPQVSASYAVPSALQTFLDRFPEPANMRHSFPSFYPLAGFVLAVGASSFDFAALQNFIGSLHFWEPSQDVQVYDLGLTRVQLAEINCWHNVLLMSFSFDRYPLHIRNLYNRAWQLLLLQDILQQDNSTAVLFMNVNMEVRRPFALSTIKREIAHTGLFLIQDDDPSSIHIAKHGFFSKLYISRQDLNGKSLCMSSFYGFLRDSPAFYQILLPAVKCALDESCVLLEQTGQLHRRVDQLALSALAYQTGHFLSPLLVEDDASRLTPDETDYNNVVIYASKYPSSFLYLRHIKQYINASCAFTPSLSRNSAPFPPRAPRDILGLEVIQHEAVKAKLELSLIEDHPILSQASSLVTCLQMRANSRLACSYELQQHELAVAAVVRKPSTKSLLRSLSPFLTRHFRSVAAWILSFVLDGFSCFVLYCIFKSSRRLLWFIVILMLILLLLCYPFVMVIVNEHGTFLPPIVAAQTRLHFIDEFSFQAGIQQSVPRVVLTMSTLPHQVEFVNETLESLVAQTRKPDAIYINLPLVNRRTGDAYNPPSWLLTGKWKDVPLYINRGEDVGPLTKLAFTLLVETHPDTIIVTCDTDKIYPPILIETLLRYSIADSTSAFGACGWSFLWRPAPIGVLPLYVPYMMRGRYGRVVDVLQAVCGNAYRRSLFPDVGSSDMKMFMAPHPHCFTTDDLWIAGWLATRSRQQPVPQVLVPGGWTMWSAQSPEPTTARWKAASSGGWELNSINKAPGIDAACIRGVEQMLGPWRQKRGMSY